MKKENEQELLNLKLNINKTSNKSTNLVNGIKNHFFHLIYILIQNQADDIFLESVLIIFQFIQLISFPLCDIFKDGWKKKYYNTISLFFQYSTITPIFEGNNQIFIVMYFFVIIYVIFNIIIFSYGMFLVSKYKLKSEFLIELLIKIFKFDSVIFLPITKMLFSVYGCEEKRMRYANDIICFGSIHWVLCVISGIMIIIYFYLSIIVHIIFYEFHPSKRAIMAKLVSKTDTQLIITKFILVFLYQFFPKEDLLLSSITLILGILFTFEFWKYKPYFDRYITNLLLVLYYTFAWSCFVSFLGLILKNTSFEGGMPMFLLGSAIIIMGTNYVTPKYSFEEILSFDQIKSEYDYLKYIKSFIKIIEASEKDIRARDNILLFGYITQYEKTCTDENCALKHFMNEDFSQDNLFDSRIFLLQHAELLYKNALNKFPRSVRLRLSFGLFLYDKLNKKTKGQNEIYSMKNQRVNLEDSFLIYRVERYMEDSTDGNLDNDGLVSSITYKSILNSFKNLISKITVNYIEFWSLLAVTEDKRADNFHKMSTIGNKISQSLEEINKTFETLIKVNPSDPDVIKLYSQFLSEVTNNQKKATLYNNKLDELEMKKNKYDENNLYTLNYKALARYEDKYIVISGQNAIFGNIINLSPSVCHLFGFTKNELVGQKIDSIMPELFQIPHKEILHEKLEEFKKHSIAKRKEIVSSTHSILKDIISFGKNKLKYLVPIKFKVGLVSTEEGEIYFISKIFESEIIKKNEFESCIVLTDIDLNIQNFTPEGPKLLNLNSSVIKNNIEITEYIKEFNEKFLKHIVSIEEQEPLKIKQIKIHLLNKLFRNRSKITWKYDGTLINASYKWKNLSKNIDSSLRSNENILSKIEVSNSLRKIKNNSNISPKKNPSSPKKIMRNPEKNKSKKTTEINVNNNFITNNIENNTNIGTNGNKLVSFSPNNSMNNTNNSNNNFIPRVNSNMIKGEDFYLSIEDVLIKHKQIGFIFKFERPKITQKDSTIIISPTTKTSIKSNTINLKNSSSNLSLSKFNGIININNLMNIESTFIPTLTDDDEFIIDLQKMAFTQFKSKQNAHHELKQLAVKKLATMTGYNSNNNSEENEENEEDESSESSSGYENKSIEYKSDNVNMLKRISTNLSKKNNEFEEKNNIDDYYHIDISKITYYIYDFKNGGIDFVKDKSYKINPVEHKTMEYKRELHENTEFTNDESKSDKGKNNNNKKKEDDDERIFYDEKQILLKQIKQALNNKETHSSIIKLCLASFVIFLMISASAILCLIAFLNGKNGCSKSYNILSKSILFHKNILVTVFYIRELLIIKRDEYINTYIPNKEEYFKNISNTCYEYFVDSIYLLSNLSTSVETLSKKNKERLQNKEISLDIIDFEHSTSQDIKIKTYKLTVFSAYDELIASLYHISQINIEKINSFCDNVYYYMRNCLNSIETESNELIQNFLDEFFKTTKSKKQFIFICMGATFLLYIICYFIFVYFYELVELKKESYLSVFYEIGNLFIFNSLMKCEKFSQKLQIENDGVHQEKVSFEDSEEYFSQSSEKLITNSSSPEKKTNNNNQMKNQIKNTEKLNHHTTNKKKGILILSSLLIYTLITYTFFYSTMNIYNYYAKFTFYGSNYQLKYLYPLIALREYYYDPLESVQGIYAKDFLEKLLEEFYDESKDDINELRLSLVHLPKNFQEYYDKIYTASLCYLIEDIFINYPNKNYPNCTIFYSGTVEYGLNTIFNFYLEEIRYLKTMMQNQINLIDESNYMNKYNSTLKYTIFEDAIGNEDVKNDENYKQLDPINLFNLESHKQSFIIFRHIIKVSSENIISHLTKNVEKQMNSNSFIGYILIFVFIGVVFFGFILGWIPFEIGENETIYKTKNMLSIIPKELLTTLPHIKIMLGLEHQKQENKKFKK